MNDDMRTDDSKEFENETTSTSGDETAFQFTFTQAFPALLEQLSATLIVTTYQAGKLVAFRGQGGRMSMLLRTFDKAMGLAVRPDRLAVATTYKIWTLYNSVEVAARLSTDGQYDACFLPRMAQVTGNLDVHEIAWGMRGDGETAYVSENSTEQVDQSPQGGAPHQPQSELWVVNTLYSCLCTLDTRYNFVPRWRPPFVSDLKRQDRCHLNGVAMVDGLPRYVTAFGETDQPEGWRPGKVDGGVVIDVESGETIARGLAMPHSPRFHDGRLWLLDSGRGQLSCVDPRNGDTQTVAELPGYTRGLALAGNLAFVGLSRIRETAIFGGVPVAEDTVPRKCGVAVVNLLSGELLAMLDFKRSVDELFDVQLLHGTRYPAIVGFQKETIQRACLIGPETPIQYRGEI